MTATLAFLPFRLVYHPTTWVGRAVAWLAEGYREAPPFERAMIFPTWAVLRMVFFAGCGLAYVLHAVGRRAARQ
jgi:cobalamin biosynthesis protein CobD/CbiB